MMSSWLKPWTGLKRCVLLRSKFLVNKFPYVPVYLLNMDSQSAQAALLPALMAQTLGDDASVIVTLGP